MKYNIRGNKIDVTEAIDKYIKEKLSRLDKYLDDNDEVEAKAVISARGKDQKVEVTIWSGKYNNLSINLQKLHKSFTFEN